MKMKFKTLFFSLLIFFGCKNKVQIDITPHEINSHADLYYQSALNMIETYYDVDSTRKAVALIDKALEIDEMNPDYYGMKAKLYAEMGLLDSALTVQNYANEIGAMNGEYLLQLGLFQAAKDFPKEAKKSFKRSNDYLELVLKQYPDSLGAFINQQAANSLYQGEDSLFMNDVKSIRERFSGRLMEIEMTRRLKPSSLIQQLKQIEADAIHDMIIEIEKEHFGNEDN